MSNIFNTAIASVLRSALNWIDPKANVSDNSRQPPIHSSHSSPQLPLEAPTLDSLALHSAVQNAAALVFAQINNQAHPGHPLSYFENRKPMTTQDNRTAGKLNASPCRAEILSKGGARGRVVIVLDEEEDEDAKPSSQLRQNIVAHWSPSGSEGETERNWRRAKDLVAGPSRNVQATPRSEIDELSSDIDEEHSIPHGMPSPHHLLASETPERAGWNTVQSPAQIPVRHAPIPQRRDTRPNQPPFTARYCCVNCRGQGRDRMLDASQVTRHLEEIHHADFIKGAKVHCQACSKTVSQNGFARHNQLAKIHKQGSLQTAYRFSVYFENFSSSPPKEPIVESRPTIPTSSTREELGLANAPGSSTTSARSGSSRPSSPSKRKRTNNEDTLSPSKKLKDKKGKGKRKAKE